MKKLFRSKKSEGLPNGPNYVNTTSEGFIITSNGQWEFPGQNTLIPSNNITMKGVPYPVFGMDDTGYSQMMYPGAEYTFPGNMVYEMPMMQSGGSFNPETDEFIGFVDELPKAQEGLNKRPRITTNPNDPELLKYNTLKRLYEFSQIPNYVFKDNALSGIYDPEGILHKNIYEKFNNALNADELGKWSDDEWKNFLAYQNNEHFIPERSDDKGMFGSKINRYKITNPNKINYADYNSGTWSGNEWLSKYKPDYYLAEDRYTRDPFRFKYSYNKNESYGGKNYWKKPKNLFIEDEINRKELKNIYPEITDEYINEEYNKAKEHPMYESNLFIPSINDYTGISGIYDGESTQDVPDSYTINTKNNYSNKPIIHYFPESFTDGIYQESYTLPQWNMPNNPIEYLEFLKLQPKTFTLPTQQEEPLKLNKSNTKYKEPYKPSKVLLREMGNINRYRNSIDGVIKEPYKNSHEVYMDDNKGWRKVSPEQYETLKQQYPGADTKKGWIKNTKKAKGGLIKAQEGKENLTSLLTDNQKKLFEERGILNKAEQLYKKYPTEVKKYFPAWLQNNLDDSDSKRLLNYSDILSNDNFEFERALVNSDQWYNNWYEKRSQIEKFKNTSEERKNISNENSRNTIQTDKISDFFRNLDVDNLNEFPNNFFENDNRFNNDIGGYYVAESSKPDVIKDKIYMNMMPGQHLSSGLISYPKQSSKPGEKRNPWSTTYHHEALHKFDFNSPQKNTRNILTLEDWNSNEISDPLQKIISKDDILTDWRTNNGKDLYQYEPTEVRARLNVWRMLNDIDPLKNYTDEELKSIIDKDLQNPDLNSNIKDLYRTLRNDPKKLKFINDNYVSNQTKSQNIQYAANGGLVKAQVGKQTYANKQGVIMGPVKNPDGSFTLPISPEGLPQVNLPEYNLNLNSDPSYGPVTLEEYLNSVFNPLNLLLPTPEQGVIIRDAKGNITGESALSPSYPEMLLLPANIGLKGNLGKFVDAVNPLSGIGQKGRNAIGSALIANAIKKGKIKPNEVPKIQRIDPINRSSVNKQNDIISNMSKEDYENFLRAVYTQNREVFDNPLIEFKSSQPSSFVSGIGSDEKQGLLFKEKFCLPGSECAKTSNSVANRIYTDITGKEFDVAGNAHNAWHLEDQMTRFGAMPVYSREQLKVGDRLLMGNGVDQSTYVPGYTADPNIRHAGTYAGIIMHEGRPYQMLFESGRNNPMFINSIDYPITGPNSLQKAFRPQQFIDDEFGVNLVDKNIRYAYRDKPSVATYSSQNKAVQDVLSEGQLYRETIKRQYDITNDEFDELLNSLVGIGAQETKLNSALPASKLLKAKIALQDKLVNTGLSRPIKQAINTGKRALNTFSTKSNLPSYPGSAKIEMDAAKLAQQEGIPFNEALQTIKSQYAPKPRFIPSTVEPSKGMFRQKFQTESDRLADVSSNIGSKESLRNALGLMSENYGKVKQLYPDASPRQLMDLTTLMWNSPGKAKNKELVDFYLFGKNNPDPSRFNFDYLRKVNDYRNNLIDIQPKSTDDYLKLFRNNEYPEIQYKRGGSYNPNTDEFLGFID